MGLHCLLQGYLYFFFASYFRKLAVTFHLVVVMITGNFVSLV
jgi:hypothetical protein